MRSVLSGFVNTIFANLGTTAQTWHRDFKISLGDQPATWSIFKQLIREPDFEHKVLSLHNLRWIGSQQAYTTKFLHLLSQFDRELPEVVKCWYYQQNLRPVHRNTCQPLYKKQLNWLNATKIPALHPQTRNWRRKRVVATSLTKNSSKEVWNRSGKVPTEANRRREEKGGSHVTSVRKKGIRKRSASKRSDWLPMKS
ncbi:hypothetical protein PHMEG_00029112 [Phytophthora megakarya]|uniref:Retrotransposon gag domain-containing protein n=1 Tax=Phytophthora megakarya TaxID=4795 RepID=A0A225V3G0_9STRA|nr:hypothetical protein PHMEG_00029112 [Phytophthora megakarya]